MSNSSSWSQTLGNPVEPCRAHAEASKKPSEKQVSLESLYLAGLLVLPFLFSFLGGRFEYFLFFLLAGGKGGVRGDRGGGGCFLLKIPGGGGSPRRGGGRGGWVGVCGEFGGEGGGLNFFFSEPKSTPSFLKREETTKKNIKDFFLPKKYRTPRPLEKKGKTLRT